LKIARVKLKIQVFVNSGGKVRKIKMGKNQHVTPHSKGWQVKG
jgi:hypothetical protein